MCGGEGHSLLSRATQGVRLMRLAEGSRVIDVEKTERESEEEKEEEPAPAENTEE